MKSGRVGSLWRLVAVLAAMLAVLGTFSSSAYAATRGWTYRNGAYYYLESNGSLRKNAWATYNGTYYYLGSNGRVLTNSWVKYGGKYYYVDSSGEPLVDSPLVLNGMRYYFDVSGVCVMSARDSGPFVSTIYSKTVESPSDGTCSYRLPTININSAAANAINTRIYSWGDEIKRSLSDIKQYGYANLLRLDYAYFVNGDVLSLVFYDLFSAGMNEGYAAVNISTKTGELLSAERVLQQVGMDTETFQSLHKAALKDYYENVYAGCEDWLGYDSCLEETLSDENLARGVPFINSKGELWVVTGYYSFIGASGYTIALALQ